GRLPYLLTLPPYGFYWFQLAEGEEGWPTAHTPAPEPLPEYQTIVIRKRLLDAVRDTGGALEREVLPNYLLKRRWFGMKDQTLQAIRLVALSQLPHPTSEILLAEIDTDTPAGSARWLLPLAVVWEDQQAGVLAEQLALA